MFPSDVRFHVYCLKTGTGLLTDRAFFHPEVRVEGVRRLEPGWAVPPVSPDLPAGAEDLLLDADLLVKLHFRAEASPDHGHLREMAALARTVATRLAGFTYDVHGRRYLSDPELRVMAARPTFSLIDHVIVHRAGPGSRPSLHTHGLAKFGHPDLRIAQLPERHVRLGAGLLIDVASAMADGMEIEPDDMLDVGPGYLKVARIRPEPDEEPSLYGRLDLHNYDLITGAASPDLAPFLDGIKVTESAAR